MSDFFFPFLMFIWMLIALLSIYEGSQSRNYANDLWKRLEASQAQTAAALAAFDRLDAAQKDHIALLTARLREVDPEWREL